MTYLSRSVLNAPRAAVAWLGRQGTRAIAALVFVGIGAPPIDALLKPFVTEAIFVLLCIAFLRVDPMAVRSYLGRPGIVFAAVGWTMLLVTLVAGSALIPITAPLLAYVFIPALTLSPLGLGLKLFIILAGSALVAFTVRGMVGPAAIAWHRDEIDGVIILVVFVFVAAVMEHVAVRFIAKPAAMIGLAALAFFVYFALLSLTAIVLPRLAANVLLSSDSWPHNATWASCLRQPAAPCLTSSGCISPYASSRNC
jgi:BASS family bile acid:Na+ symporter